MVFIINKLKYDTSKMMFVTDKCEYSYKHTNIIGTLNYMGRNVKLYRSKKGNWLLTYETDYENRGVALTEEEAEKILLKYDYESYEKIFGELEEA